MASKVHGTTRSMPGSRQAAELTAEPLSGSAFTGDGDQLLVSATNFLPTQLCKRRHGTQEFLKPRIVRALVLIDGSPKMVSVSAIGESALTPGRCSSSSPAWRASFGCSIPVRSTTS